MNILKQSVVWVTDLRRRLSNDIFFATHIKIVVCLTLLVAIITGSFIFLVEYVKRSLLSSVVDSLLLALASGVTDPTILATTNAGTNAATFATIGIVIISALIVGIIVSRLALSPLRQAFQMQKRFIVGIAHELRTPLSILRMNNEIARFDLKTESNVSELLDENIADIDRINEILGNLLLFDRIASTESLRLEEVDLNALMVDIATRLRDLSVQKRVEMHVSEGNIPTILGNKIALEQVFFNILKNALSYTPAGGSVSITCPQGSPHAVSVRVSDTGVGIPEKDLPHIFEPFYRTDRTGKLAGTGMGLAVVYEIVKLHKGTIEVESTGGKGTTFTLSFLPFQPIAKEPSGAPLSKVEFNFQKTLRH